MGYTDNTIVVQLQIFVCHTMYMLWHLYLCILILFLMPVLYCHVRNFKVKHNLYSLFV